MRSILSLIKKLRDDNPEFIFAESDKFLWSPRKKTVFYNTNETNSLEYTLHELSHALLGHESYIQDIDLIKLERDAWDYARDTLSKKYDIEIDEDLVQDNLDTYRDWLYSRSACPECDTTGIQTKQQQYKCLACSHMWRVNEAKLCTLRRYTLSQAK